MSEQVILKRCSKCKITKPLDQFRKCASTKDGLRYWCNGCEKEYQQSEKGKKANKRYAQSEQGKKAIKHYTHSKKARQTCHRYRTSEKARTRRRCYKKANREKFPESERISHSRYKQSEKGKSCARKYRQKYPERTKAYQAIYHAIQDGYIPEINSRFCLLCFHKAKYYHHLAGYEPENWYRVISVCPKCHSILHQHKLVARAL